jgi:hypothetical protein
VTEQPQPSKEEIVEALTTLRTQMLAELHKEYIGGMNQAFKIGIDGLEKSLSHPIVGKSEYQPGLRLAVDLLKDMQKESTKTFDEAHNNALNTASETHTGETKNG